MDNAKIIIEKMKESDADFVERIEKDCGLGEWGKNVYLSELKRPEALLFVAKNKDETIGFVSARLITKIVEILNIAVLPEYRKRGIGNLLLKKILQNARSSGCESCWLEVRESNTAARNFYQTSGFEIAGKRKNYYSNPAEDAILLNLDLGK